MNFIDIELENFKPPKYLSQRLGIKIFNEENRKRFQRYEGTFICLGEFLIPFPKIPFINYQKAKLDFERDGNHAGVFHNNFELNCPEISLENGNSIYIQRKGYIGKIKDKSSEAGISPLHFSYLDSK